MKSLQLDQNIADYLEAHNELVHDKPLTSRTVKNMVRHALAAQMKWKLSKAHTKDRVEMGERLLKLLKENLQRHSYISQAIEDGVFNVSGMSMSYVYSSDFDEESEFLNAHLAMLGQLLIYLNVPCEYTSILSRVIFFCLQACEFESIVRLLFAGYMSYFF